MGKNLRERLEEFIAYKQMSVRKFEKICEFSNGYVRTINRSIVDDKMERITKEFPELNKTWLITGDGGMIVDR